MLHSSRAARLATLALSGGMVAAITALPTTAHAATPTFGYNTYVGGTRITAVGMHVSSDLTAESQLKGYKPDKDNNSVAKVKAGSLAKVGPVTTRAVDTKFGDGNKIVSHAKTAGISLLGGLIKVDAIKTTGTAKGNSNKKPTSSIKTKLVGLTIAGKKYPANVPANTSISIPGVANITLNYSLTGKDADEAVAYGGGLVVTLLKKRNGAAAGAEIVVNPIAVQLTRLANPAEGRPVGGLSYGSYVATGVGDNVTVKSDRTASLGMPSYGTDGNVLTNSTARANLFGVLNLGTIETSTQGVQSLALSTVKQTASISRLTLFGGAIHASALSTTAEATSKGTKNPKETTSGSTDFVKLKIAGKKIPINVAPNTTIHVARLGTVTINKKEVVNVKGKGFGIRETGIQIVLDTKRAGLPVGAVVELASSTAVIFG